MKNNFYLDKSIYIMIGFVSLFGIIFILIRSDYLLNYKYFNENTKVHVEKASSKELAEAYGKPTLLVLTSNDQASISTSIETTLKELGKKVISVDIGDDLDLTHNNYEGIVIATETLNKMENVEELLTYVEKGGSVFFAIRPSPGSALSTLYQRLGMIEVGSFIETKGIELSEPIFKETHSQSFLSNRIVNSSLSVRLSKAAKVYATSSDGLPLFWSTAYGSGKFIMFNGTILADPSQQALLIQGVQKMVPHMIYPVMNARVTALKGFPFPISGGTHVNGGMTNEEYFHQVIWADMQRSEAKFDLNYTASYVDSYSETPTFESNKSSASLESLVTFGRELLRMGGEIGVQGFNHEPISQKNSTEAQNSLNEVASRLNGAIPDYPITSYIPVDQKDPLANVNTIQNVFPELKVILGDVPTPMANDQITTLPITISGFEPDDYSNWLLVNEIAKRGYFSHTLSLEPFVYTNDFEKANQNFSLFQNKVQADVPWLRSLTLSQAADAFPSYNQTEIYEEVEANEITFHLTRYSSPSFFYFYTEAGITDTENCHLTKIGTNLYLIEAEKLSFTIRLDG
jgi:hypothetical protein